VLRSRSGVVLDATFSSQANRAVLREQCTQANVRLQVVEVDLDLATMGARLKARDKSVGEISDARLEDLEKLNAAYEPPTELMDNMIKLSAGVSVSDTVKTILFKLAEQQLR
jgi:predicted kinase